MDGALTTRILIVDDDEDDYLIIRNLLSRIPDSPFTLEWVADVKQAKRRIRTAKHDIYFIDYRLGAQTGLELLADFDLLQRPEPFILLTGGGDELIERQAMRMGVADYLVKGNLDSELLTRVIRYALQRKYFEAQRIQQLIEINRSKDEFIALASHQLRTPATAVKQYLGMVIEGYAGDISIEQRRFMESAYESNERQIQVVNDILRVAKLDLKKIVLKKEPTDMGELVDSILHDMGSTFKGREQRITYHIPKKSIVAAVDSEYIRMAIGNIIDNASKYTPPGKAISVITETIGDEVCIRIQDQGVGIESKDIDKLFRKFSRIENPLSVKVGGTGLGLYWSKEVATLHGGDITVESVLNEGTTFNISLPISARRAKL